MDTSSTIKIITSDGQKVEIPKEIADNSESEFMKQLGEEPDTEIEIKEEECKKWCFDKILEFYAKYKETPYPTLDYPLKSENLEENGLGGEFKWYADFLE